MDPFLQAVLLMPVANGIRLLELAPIVDMIPTKERAHGVSHGLAEVGYDIRIEQDIVFTPPQESWVGGNLIFNPGHISVDGRVATNGRFTIASAMEEFIMPQILMGIVHDKSTWARRGLSVFNTVIEPGWKGFLTLELVFHGNEKLHIPAGSGIAQVVFHELTEPAAYAGKYQNQGNQPIPALLD